MMRQQESVDFDRRAAERKKVRRTASGLHA